MLLEVDGLNEPWDAVKVPTSEWDGELGHLDSNNIELIPEPIRRAMSPAALRDYDSTDVGADQNRRSVRPGSGGTGLEEESDLSLATKRTPDNEEVRVVRNLNQNFLGQG